MKMWTGIFWVTALVQAALGQDVQVISQHEGGCTVRVDLTKMQIQKTGIAPYSRVDFTGVAFEGEPGEPMLPSCVLLFALPSGAGAEVSVLPEGEETRKNVDLIPLPHLAGDGGLSPESYKRGAAYERDASLPGRRFSVETVMMGSQRLLRLTLYPVQFNPVKKSLSLSRRLQVDVRYTGAQPFMRSASADRSLLSRTVNAAQAMTWAVSRRAVSRRAGKQSAGGQWYKIPVTEEGVYRITGAWLESQGVSTTSIDVSTVKVFHNDGRQLEPDARKSRLDSLVQLPVQLTGMDDGSWDSGDALLFYAKGVQGVHRDGSILAHHNHIYESKNIVWLCFNDGMPGKRIAEAQAVSAENSTVVDRFEDLAFYELDTVNPAKQGAKWYGPAFRTGFLSRTLDLGIEYPVSQSPMTFNVAVAGLVDGRHGFALTLGGQLLSEFSFVNDTDVKRGFQWTGDPGAGPHALTLSYLYSGSSENPEAYLDWVEVTYSRELRTDLGRLRFYTPASAGRYDCRLKGFNQAPSVWNISDKNSITSRPVTASGSEWSVILDQGGAQPQTLYAFSEQSLLEPASIATAKAPALREDLTGAQMVVLTHVDFMEAAQKLAAHRRNYSGLSVQVVDVADVYDNFSWGLYDPVAIRDFLSFAKREWTVPPEFLLLLGDGDFDHRNLMSDEDKNWMPPYERAGRGNSSGRATDDFYAYVTGNDFTLDLAIGRLPVRSASEANTVVDKIIAYDATPERGDWRQHITLVADDEKGQTANEIRHTQATERLADNVIPGRFNLRKIYSMDYPEVITGDGVRKPLATQAIIDQVNRGTLWMNYIGHGNQKLWGHEWMLHRDLHLSAFSNQNKPVFVYAATCLFGWFDKIDEESTTEELIRGEDFGAVAVISATRECSPGPNESLNSKFTQLVLSESGPTLTVGKAMQMAKASSGSISNNEQYHLFGDPAMRLAVPRYETVLTSVSPDTLKALAVVRVTGEVMNQGTLWSGFNGTVRLETQDALRPRVHTTAAGSRVPYDLPGNALFRGEAEVRDGRFETAFIVPKDISYGEHTGRISTYFWNDTTDGCGYRNNMVVGGSANIVDGEGPEVDLFFTGREDFVDGDIVPQPAELVMAVADDKTGVNITGEIGHKLTIAVDGGEPLDATEGFRYDSGSYLAGKVRYTLDALAPGRHDVTVKAWDNANNSASRTLGFEIIEGGTLKIDALLNYPNPMSSQTHFTFRLSHEAEIDIKIYTVSGRMIRHLQQVDGEAGFNMIPWDGLDAMGDAPANGVYLYKVFAWTRWEDPPLKKEKLGRLMIFR